MPRTDNSPPVRPFYTYVSDEIGQKFAQACREAGIYKRDAIEWAMKKFIKTVEDMNRGKP
jgi:galactose-1-phosphate uridylyltransferase